MRWFKPRYKIEVSRLGYGFKFYIWHWCNIVESGYGFSSAVDAAKAANVAKKDLLDAWELAR